MKIYKTYGNDSIEIVKTNPYRLADDIWGIGFNGDPIPFPTSPEKIVVSMGAFVTIIEARMKLIRDEMADKAVKKTLTIPKWLNDLAVKNHLNFSHVLQSALKDHLGLR